MYSHRVKKPQDPLHTIFLHLLLSHAISHLGSTILHNSSESLTRCFNSFFGRWFPMLQLLTNAVVRITDGVTHTKKLMLVNAYVYADRIRFPLFLCLKGGSSNGFVELIVSSCLMKVCSSCFRCLRYITHVSHEYVLNIELRALFHFPHTKAEKASVAFFFSSVTLCQRHVSRSGS